MKKKILAFVTALALLLPSFAMAYTTTVPWRYNSITNHTYPYPNNSTFVGWGMSNADDIDAYLHIAPTFTLGTPTNLGMSESAPSGCSSFNTDDFVQYQVYAWKNINGSKVFSDSLLPGEYTVVNTGFGIDLSWTAVTGANGYRIVSQFTGRNSGLDTWTDVSTNTVTDTNDCSVFTWTNGTPTLTPISFSPISKAIYDDGTTLWGFWTNLGAYFGGVINSQGASTTNQTITAKLFDVNGGAGTNGQVLSSTASGIDWIDAPSTGTNYLTNSSSNTFLNTGSNLQAPTFEATSTTATTSLQAVAIATSSETTNSMVELNGGFHVEEKQLATSTSMSVDFCSKNTNNKLVMSILASNITFTWTNYQKCVGKQIDVSVRAPASGVVASTTFTASTATDFMWDGYLNPQNNTNNNSIDTFTFESITSTSTAMVRGYLKSSNP